LFVVDHVGHVLFFLIHVLHNFFLLSLRVRLLLALVLFLGLLEAVLIVSLHLLYVGLIYGVEERPPELLIRLAGQLVPVVLVLVDKLVHEVAPDDVVELVLLLLHQFLLQLDGLFLELRILGFFLLATLLLIFSVLLHPRLTAIFELVVHILQKEFLIIDDLSIFLQTLFEFLPFASEFEVFSVAFEAELFLFVSQEEDIVMEEVGVFLEVVGAWEVGVVEFLFDEGLDEGVDVGLEEEGVAKGWQKSGLLAVDAPHAVGQEGFGELVLSHELFELLIKGDFFIEIFDDIFVVAEEQIEILPEMKIVLPQTEQFFLSWILLVFLLQKGHEL
jgi:hypothetical protein